VFLTLAIISFKCQTYPLDADCYYKSPYLYIRNNNTYNWTDILIKIRINKNRHNKKTFLYNIKNFNSGNDTTINIVNMANSMKDYKKDTTSTRHDIKVDFMIVTYQGKLNKHFIIKD
jgi:hypothetical protein